LNKVLLAVLVTVSFSVLLGSQEAFAAAKTWDGGAGTLNWNDGDNWNPNGVPAPNDIITIPSGNDVTLDIDFTVGISGTLTIEPTASLLVDKNKKLRNFNVITNGGDLVIDGKVETTDTFTNQDTGTIDILGDGSANNGVFITSGTVNDVGKVESNKAKWTNTGTYNKNKGLFNLSVDSEFTNKEKGVLNIIGTATTMPQFVINIRSDFFNTQESKINIANGGSLEIQNLALLDNELLSQININDKGSLDISSASELVNTAKLNVNPGGVFSITLGLATFTKIVNNAGPGVITNQGAPGNPALIQIISGKLISDSAINNNSDGIIEIFSGGVLENQSPGSLKNNKGAEIKVNGDGVLNGLITGTGGVINEADNSITNFGIIDISGPWQNFGKIENEGIINVLCGGSINPLGTIIGAGEFNVFGCPVGGSFTPIDRTMVLLGATETTASWMIPVIVAGIGIAIVIARKF